MNKSFYLVGAVIVLVAVAYLGLRESAPQESAPEPVLAATLPVEREEVTATIEPEVPPVQEEVTVELVSAPPSLKDSDKYVFEVVETIAPPMVQWLVPDEQVRKWVLAIDLLASGKLPQRHKPLAYDMPGFKVDAADDGGWVVSESSLDRLTPLIDTVTAIDPKTLGQYYQSWLPLLQSAYQELGNKQEFQQRVDEMIMRIQSVGPAPEGAVLVRPHVLFQYSDPALEKSTALEKWLWRMGDKNREKLQAYLRELKFYL